MATIKGQTLTHSEPPKHKRAPEVREHGHLYAGSSHANPHKGLKEMRGEVVKNSNSKNHQFMLEGQKG